MSNRNGQTPVRVVIDEADEFDAWWRDALCLEIGAELFFVNKGGSVDEAKAVCALCPVRTQCLADALQRNSQYGVFGGFSRTQRIRLRRPVDNGADPRLVAAAAIDQANRRRPSWMTQ